VLADPVGELAELDPAGVADPEPVAVAQPADKGVGLLLGQPGGRAATSTPVAGEVTSFKALAEPAPCSRQRPE
jgi:hypothetical protein